MNALKPKRHRQHSWAASDVHRQASRRTCRHHRQRRYCHCCRRRRCWRCRRRCRCRRRHRRRRQNVGLCKHKKYASSVSWVNTDLLRVLPAQWSFIHTSTKNIKNGFRQFPLKWSQSLEEFLPLWSSRAALRLEFKYVAYIVKVQCCFTTLVEAKAAGTNYCVIKYYATIIFHSSTVNCYCPVVE